MSTREECIKNDKNDKELNTSLSSSEIDEIVILWNSVSTEISNLSGIKQNSKRMESVKARVAEYSYSQFLDAISNVKSSSFLTGKNYKNWKITFDWMIRPNNFPKVLEGNYTDRKEMADETNKRDVAKEYGVKVV